MVQTEKKPASDRPQQHEQPQQPPKGASSLPKPPARKIGEKHADQGFAYLKTLGDADWAHATLYIYRTWPIFRTAGVKYIDKVSTAVTEEQLLQRHGAGRYKLLLSDADRGKYGEVLEIRVNLQDSWADHPPVIENWAELDQQAPENRAFVNWARANNFLNMQPQPAAGGLDPSVVALITRLVEKLENRKPSNDAEGKAIDSVIATLGKANEKSLEMMAKQQDPKEALTLLTLLEKLLDRDKKGGGDMDMLRFVLEQQTKQHELTMRLIESRLGNQASNDPIEQVQKFAGAMAAMKEAFGGGGSSESNWVDLVKSGIEQLPATLAQAAALARAANPQAAPAVGAAPRAQVVNVPAAGQPAPPAQSPDPGTAPSAPAGDVMFQQLLNAYGGIIVNAVLSGTKGDEIAQSLDTFSKADYDALYGLGKERIMAELKANASVWSKLSSREAAVEKFVDQFLEYGDPETSEPETPEPETPEPETPSPDKQAAAGGPQRIK